MRALVIGIQVYKRDNSFNHFKGFTLIEMLLVVVIISILMTAAVMTFGNLSVSRKLKMKSSQLMSSILAAKAQAILMPQLLSLKILKDGYQFYVFSKNENGKYEWRTLQNDMLSQPNAFHSNIKAKIISLDGDESTIWLLHRKNKMILFMPSGEITPFKLEIMNPAHTVIFYLQMNKAGEMSLTSSNS